MKWEFVAFLIAISASFCNAQQCSNGNEEMDVESSGGNFNLSPVNQSSSAAMSNSLNDTVLINQQTSNQLNTSSSTLILEAAPVSGGQATSFQLQNGSQPTISVTEYNSVNELGDELAAEINSFINQEMQNEPNALSENVASSISNSHVHSEMQPQLNNESGSSLQPNEIQTNHKICTFTPTLQQYNLLWNTFPYPQHTSQIFTEHLSNKYSFLCQCIRYSSKLKSFLKETPTATTASKFWNYLIPYPSLFPYLKQLKLNRIVHQSIFYIGPTLYPQKSVSRKRVVTSALFSIYQFVSTLQSFFLSSGNLIDDFYDLFFGSSEIGFYFAMDNSRLMSKLEKLRKFSHFLKMQVEVAQTFANWYKECLKRSSEPITFGTLDFVGFGNISCNFELGNQLRITSTDSNPISGDTMASEQMNDTEQSVRIDLSNLQQSLSIDSVKNFHLYNIHNHPEHWWSTCIRVYIDYKDNYILDIARFSAHFSSIYRSIIKFENTRGNFYESFLIILYRFLNRYDSLTRFFHTIYPRYNLLKISSWYYEEILDCAFDLYFKLTRDGYPFLCSSMLELISNEETGIFVKEILPTFQMETFLSKFQQWCKVRNTTIDVLVEQKVACKKYLEHFQLQKDYFMNSADGMVNYVKAFWNVEEVWEEEMGREEEKDDFCSICRDVFTKEAPAFYPQHLRLYSKSQTYHPIHYECWKMLKQSNNFKCPFCRTPLNPVK